MVLALATLFVFGAGDLACSFLQIVVTSDDRFKGANAREDGKEEEKKVVGETGEGENEKAKDGE